VKLEGPEGRKMYMHKKMHPEYPLEKCDDTVVEFQSVKDLSIF
jgi:hypothetical protein